MGMLMNSKVSTPQGDGRIVHLFGDGTVAVELDHCGVGKIYYPEEILPRFAPVGKTNPERDSHHGRSPSVHG